jgi:hypothetical protein
MIQDSSDTEEAVYPNHTAAHFDVAILSSCHTSGAHIFSTVPHTVRLILFLFYESPILHHLVVSCPRYSMLLVSEIPDNLPQLIGRAPEGNTIWMRERP